MQRLTADCGFALLFACPQPGEELFFRDRVLAGQRAVEPGGHVGGAFCVPGQFESAQAAGQFDALAVGEVIHFFEDFCEAHRVGLKRPAKVMSTTRRSAYPVIPLAFFATFARTQKPEMARAKDAKDAKIEG